MRILVPLWIRRVGYRYWPLRFGGKRGPERIYIIHSDDDLEHCRSLAKQIETGAAPSPVVVYYRGSMVFGSNLRETIEEQIAFSSRVIVLVSVRWLAIDEEFGELAVAERYQKPIIPILVAPVELDSLHRLTRYVRRVLPVNACGRRLTPIDGPDDRYWALVAKQLREGPPTDRLARRSALGMLIALVIIRMAASLLHTTPAPRAGGIMIAAIRWAPTRVRDVQHALLDALKGVNEEAKGKHSLATVASPWESVLLGGSTKEELTSLIAASGGGVLVILHTDSTQPETEPAMEMIPVAPFDGHENEFLYGDAGTIAALLAAAHPLAPSVSNHQAYDVLARVLTGLGELQTGTPQAWALDVPVPEQGEIGGISITILGSLAREFGGLPVTEDEQQALRRARVRCGALNERPAPEACCLVQVLSLGRGSQGTEENESAIEEACESLHRHFQILRIRAIRASCERIFRSIVSGQIESDMSMRERTTDVVRRSAACTEVSYHLMLAPHAGDASMNDLLARSILPRLATLSAQSFADAHRDESKDIRTLSAALISDRGRMLGLSGDWKRAHDDFRAASSLNPLIPSYRLAAAEAALYVGEPEAALDSLDANTDADLVHEVQALHVHRYFMIWLAASMSGHADRRRKAAGEIVRYYMNVTDGDVGLDDDAGTLGAYVCREDDGDRTPCQIYRLLVSPKTPTVLTSLQGVLDGERE